jgi:hypothetical protein
MQGHEGMLNPEGKHGGLLYVARMVFCTQFQPGKVADILVVEGEQEHLPYFP